MANLNASNESQPLLAQPPTTPSRTPQLKRVQTLLGFSKAYNFTQWTFMCCLMFIVLLNGLSFIGVLDTRFPPGDWYWFSQPFYKFGIILHLMTILPCGFLAVFQFVPAIRYKWIAIHRLNGLLVYSLLALAIVGALIIAPHSLGGTPSSQTAIVVTAALSATSASLAWYNIRFRRRIDLHRKWNIRAAFYTGSAITERVFLNGLALIFASRSHKDYFVWTCDELRFLIPNGTDVLQRYPSCAQSSVAAVPASFDSAENIGTALRISFGASTWLAISLHAVLAELYIQMTWSESSRLEQISKAKEATRTQLSLATSTSLPGSMDATPTTI